MNQEKEKYNNEVQKIKDSFMNALEQYKEAYVLAKMNPNDANYKSAYESKIDQIEKILLNMNVLGTNIQNDINYMTNNISELENKTISEINEKVMNLNDSQLGSKTFASDLNVLTGNQRLQNKGLVVGITMLGLFILFFHKL